MNLLSRTLSAMRFMASGEGQAEPKRPGPDNDFWYTEAPQKNASGIQVTADIALKASAVFACIKIIAEGLGSLSLQMYKAVPGGREPAPSHPLDELIRYQPNSWQTAIEFWEMMLLHAALRGTAYAEIVPGPRGAVDQLLPLHTDRVRPQRLAGGVIRFEITDPGTGKTRYLMQEEMFRVPGLSSNGLTGLRAVDIAAEAIGLGMAADQYAGRVFSNKLNIGGFLVHPGKLSEPAQKNLIHALMLRFATVSNAHRPMILQEGLKFEKAAMDASEAQLLEARKFQISEIARFWRVPAHMLNIFDGVTRSNVEQQAFDFVKYTLRPWATRVEQAIRRDLITAPQLYSAGYDFDDLLRGDSISRAEYNAQALGSGGHSPWMTVNEVRKREGLNPLPGGDQLAAPTNSQFNKTRNDKPPAEDAAAIEAAAKRLVNKECTAIRRAQMRFAGDHEAFREWASAFYGGHRSAVVSALGIPLQAARKYCDFQRDELLAANDIDGLLVRREEKAVALIAAAIKNWKESE
jgi:HK97 family phage portal protein